MTAPVPGSRHGSEASRAASKPDPKEGRMRFVLAGLALAVASGASATVIATPPVFAPVNTDVRCYASNLGTKPLEISVRYRDGNAGGSPAATAVTLQPGGADGPTRTGQGAVTTCEFEFKGNKKLVRGALSLTPQAASQPIVVLPAQ
jgi:hypothetical protein